MESTSSCVQDISNEIQGMISGLKSMNRKGMGSKDFSTAIKLAGELSILLNSCADSTKSLWDDFIKESNATLHPFDQSDSVSVFDAYFSGEKPFKSLKNRADIPDAFIFQTIKKISKIGVVHLISGDKKLTEKCANEQNVIIHNDFQIFFAHEAFKIVDTAYKKIKESGERVSRVYDAVYDLNDLISDAVEKYTSKIRFLQFSDDKLASDDKSAHILAIDRPKLTVDEFKTRIIEDKVFLEIRVMGIATIEYSIFKDDYWVNEERAEIIEDLNRHYYTVLDEVNIYLKKSMSFDIEELLNDEIGEIEISQFDRIGLQ